VESYLFVPIANWAGSQGGLLGPHNNLAVRSTLVGRRPLLVGDSSATMGGAAGGSTTIGSGGSMHSSWDALSPPTEIFETESCDATLEAGISAPATREDEEASSSVFEVAL